MASEKRKLEKRSETATAQEVYAAERKRIEIRRREAGLSNGCCSAGVGKEGDAIPANGVPCEDDDLHTVGLALSGGGLRSAMFNLGLLQALQSSGLMRFVDYISTISGGGYVGGYYAALGNTGIKVTRPKRDDSNQKPNGAPTGAPVAGNAPASAPTTEWDNRLEPLDKATHRFINAGLYLNQVWSFVARYIWAIYEERIVKPVGCRKRVHPVGGDSPRRRCRSVRPLPPERFQWRTGWMIL